MLLYLNLLRQNIYKISLRFSPSILLLFLSVLADKFSINIEYKSWYLDLMLAFPIYSCILRLGMPLKILSKNIVSDQEPLMVKKYQAIINALLCILYFITGAEELIILLISSIGALYFNEGVKKIREGSVVGYFYQNGIIYLLLCLTFLFQRFFFENIGLFIFLLFMYSIWCIIKYWSIRLKPLDLKSYFSDLINSFVVPIIIYLSFKFESSLDVDDFIIIKSTAVLSSSLGSLLILKFKKMDHLRFDSDKFKFFTAGKYELINLYLILVFGLISFTITMYFEKVFLLLLLLLFESIWFFCGQFNLLNIYFNRQTKIILANILSLASIAILAPVINLINIPWSGIILYLTGCSLYQSFSFIIYKYIRWD